MSTTTQTLAHYVPPTAAAWDGQLNQAQQDLLERMCAGATSQERALLMQTAAAMGLNPVIGGYIHGVKRYDGRQRREILTIQVGIAGYRLCALRSGDFQGRKGPEWCAADGQWRDSWTDPRPPAACRVGILRRGFTDVLWHVEHFSEAVQTSKEGKPLGLWGKRPAAMLAKCAEAGALRAAFPDLLSGTYAPEEMGGDDSQAVTGIVVEGRPDPIATADDPAALEKGRKALLQLAGDRAALDAWLKRRKTTLEQLSLADLRNAYLAMKREREEADANLDDVEEAEATLADAPEPAPATGQAPSIEATQRQLEILAQEKFGSLDGDHDPLKVAAWMIAEAGHTWDTTSVDERLAALVDLEACDAAQVLSDWWTLSGVGF